MDAHIFLGLERLEALMISLRDEVAELRDRVDASSLEQRRLTAELGVKLIEERSYLLELEHTAPPTEPRQRG